MWNIRPVIRTSFLALLALDLYAAPIAFAGVQNSAIHIPTVFSKSSCGCTGRTKPDEAKAWMGSGWTEPLTPIQCASVTGACVPDTGYITCCMWKNQLTCDLWKHEIKIWYCQGKTYYTCDGYSWFDSGLTCTNNCVNTLPVGCPSPNLGWTYCQ